MSTKEAVIELIRRMPNDTTIQDIIVVLTVRQKVDEGLRELDEGRGVPHEVLRTRLARWLA